MKRVWKQADRTTSGFHYGCWRNPIFRLLTRRHPHVECIALKSRLQTLIDRGENESPQAEELRTRMDKLWIYIPDAKRQEINRSVTLPNLPD